MKAFLLEINISKCEEWMPQHDIMHQKYWLMTLASMILTIVNLITNLIAFIIFYRDSAYSVLNQLLMTLSLFEVLFQKFYLAYLIIELHLLLKSKLIFTSLNTLMTFAGTYLWFIIPGLTAFHIARNWMVVMVSFYRFEMLIRTFSTKWILFRKERIAAICWVIVLISCVLGSPRIVERNVYYCSISKNNTELQYLLIGLSQWDFKYKEYFVYGYKIVILFLFQNGGPTFLVSFVSVTLILKLRERASVRHRLRNSNPNSGFSENIKQESLFTRLKKWRSSKNSSTKTSLEVEEQELRQSKMELSPLCEISQMPIVNEKGSENPKTSCRQSSKQRNNQNHKGSGGRLIIILCVIFGICEMPLFFSKLIHGIKIFMKQRVGATLEILLIVANFGSAIDSFANFFIYLLSNSRFRSLLLETIKSIQICPKKQLR